MKYYLKPSKDGRLSFYDKAIVKEDDKNAVLFSYGVEVCKIDKKKKVFFLNKEIQEGLIFSNTTLRHIKEFLYQFDIKNAPKTKNDFLKIYRS